MTAALYAVIGAMAAVACVLFGFHLAMHADDEPRESPLLDVTPTARSERFVPTVPRRAKALRGRTCAQRIKAARR